jgi:hypothetical protein
MKHIASTSWVNVRASLVAAGVERVLAVRIVDILMKDTRKKRDKYSTPLILSKAQMVDVPRKDARVMGDVDQIMPRLFLVTQQLLTAPNLKRKHEAYQYCRHAALIAVASAQS